MTASRSMLLRIALLISVFGAVVAGAPVARAVGIVSTDITFTRSDATTTNGTVHAPAGASGRPGIVLVHGSGTAKSPQYDQVATALAREGIVALRYDKRTDDYTPAHRDYSLLADDALAGVAALRDRTGSRSGESRDLGSFRGWLGSAAGCFTVG